MSIYVTSNFIKKRGMSQLFRFQEMLNEGKSLDEIGNHFNISAARVNILRNKIFVRKYIFHVHVEKFLECHVQSIERSTREIKDRLKDNVIEFHRE